MEVIKDGSIIWLKIDKIGTPDTWEAGKNYVLGDVIIPSSPSEDLAEYAFQVIGFLGKTGATSPSFSDSVDSTTIDGSIEWIAIDKTKNPPQLDVNEFYVISKETTVN